MKDRVVATALVLGSQDEGDEQGAALSEGLCVFCACFAGWGRGGGVLRVTPQVRVLTPPPP